MKKKRQSFSLIELMGVIIILGILFAIVFNIVKWVDTSDGRAKVKTQIQRIRLALIAYKNDYGIYYQVGMEEPLNDTHWSKFVDRDGNSYLRDADNVFNMIGSNYVDSWGNTFFYQCPGHYNRKSFDLWSKGPDSISGNRDDIKNWK